MSGYQFDNNQQDLEIDYYNIELLQFEDTNYFPWWFTFSECIYSYKQDLQEPPKVNISQNEDYLSYYPQREQISSNIQSEDYSTNEKKPNLEQPIMKSSQSSQNYSYQFKQDTQEKGNSDQMKKKLIQKQKIQTAVPGESKNLHKCYGRQLQLFIKNFCEKKNNCAMIEDQDINWFLSLKGDKIGKFELNKILNSPKGKIFSKEFFGQCLWKFNVVKESKTSVQQLFRHNIEQFWEVNKKRNQKNEINL